MKRLIALSFLFALSACGDDDNSSTSLCGEGDKYRVSTTDICVYLDDSTCPGSVPIERQWGDAKTCSNAEVPSAFENELKSRYPDADISTPVIEICANAVAPTFSDILVGNVAMETFTIENCGTEAFEVSFENDDTFSLSPDSATVAPGIESEFTLTVTGSEVGTQESNVVLAIGDTTETVAISVQIVESISTCATAMIVAENADGMMGTDIAATIPTDGVVATLDGSMSTSANGAITQYVWSLDSAPAGSNAELSDTSGETISLSTWSPGQYVISLDVLDNTGESACSKATATLDVSFAGELAIELVWNTPGDSNLDDDIGADLDLHLAHPDGLFADPLYDCYWDNAQPEWGAAGASDNPHYILNDRNGAGPEIILLETAEAITYRVGVFYTDSSGYGTSNASIRIYSEGVLIGEAQDQALEDTNKFWLVGSVDPSADSFTPDDLVIDGYPDF